MNMYTELPHPSIRSAAAHFLQWFRGVHPRAPTEWLVDLRRRRVYASRHQFDAQRCVRVRVTDLLSAVAFELDNIYFNVGDVVLRQQLGISMGGYLSPAMAMMTCMVAERSLHRTLGADARFISGMRYMDDGGLVLRVPAGRPALLAHMRALALAAYPQGMQCIVTHEGQHCRMLEQEFTVRDGAVAVAHRNKNADALLRCQPPPFTSFLPYSTPNGVAFYAGWLKGSCSRILSNTCTIQPLYTISLSLLVLFLESTYLGYPSQWFHHAIRAFRPKQSNLPWAEALQHALILVGGLSL